MTEPTQAPEVEPNRIDKDKLDEMMKEKGYNLVNQVQQEFILTPPSNGSIVTEIKAEIEMLEIRIANRKAVLAIVLQNATVIDEFLDAYRAY
jgi:hypothetical protein